MTVDPAFGFMSQAATTTTQPGAVTVPATTSAAVPSTTAAESSLASGARDDSGFPAYLVAGIALATVIALFVIYRNIRVAKNWSMSDALSEDVELTLKKPDTGETILGADNKPILEKVMKASSSRLIALVGTIAILMLYVGAGLVVLRDFATSGKIPADTDKLTTFFLSGMVLFAPYIINKFSSVFGMPKP